MVAKKEKEEKYKAVMQWKKAYTEALIDALQPTGNVLEIGFGPAFAARRIQSYNPKSHTIIESDKEIAKEVEAWAKGHSNVKVIHDTWQHALPSLGKFDTIFFNDYSATSDSALLKFLFSEELSSALSESKTMLQGLKDQFSLVKVCYSDQEIDDFYEKRGKAHTKELGRFFRSLKENGNISQSQYENALKKYPIEKEKDEIALSSLPQAVVTMEPMMEFFEGCFEKLMHKGSRFSAFLSHQSSKYDDSQFFSHIITNPLIEYKEEWAPLKIHLPQKSDAFNKGLVIVIEKKL